ncbi:antibiotic biosynthesis monooxygenase family protein [Pelagibacterium montanilacus]|uniref:antibiotic biosynthesis monooxygenase family protein n=1 Tax=Pelagibacterium montanilacus TaxID=2185280 RepID=UPI000F8C5A2E|nr:antibiotic biosynthesis monooxygenase family protein [Pelagibacterium montanilacus]
MLEIARIEVKPGMEAAFEEGAAKAAPLFKRAKGCQSMQVRRCAEEPEVYLLMVEWETLENHTVDFRNSEDFQAWRECVSHCFAKPPFVQHFDLSHKHF